MASKKNVKFKLSDDTIAQLVKLLQLGLLTGTDIADQFRTIELVPVNGMLDPDPEYLEIFEKNIQKLQDEVDAMSNSKNTLSFKNSN